jgi:hypothetical protein
MDQAEQRMEVPKTVPLWSVRPDQKLRTKPGRRKG